MSKIMPEGCPRCGGFSRFYHTVKDDNVGYVKCERCGYAQRRMSNREEAIIDWNKKNNAGREQRIWDNYEEITEVRKSNGIKFVIAAATRNGYRYINIREFYLRQKDGFWMPSRDGITIPLLMPLNNGEEFIKPIVGMLEGINKAHEFAATMELIDDEKAVIVKKKG